MEGEDKGYRDNKATGQQTPFVNGCQRLGKRFHVATNSLRAADIGDAGRCRAMQQIVISRSEYMQKCLPAAELGRQASSMEPRSAHLLTFH